MLKKLKLKKLRLGFPGGSVVKNPPAKAGDQFCTYKDPIFRTHFSLGSEITGFTALSPFGLSFFSTRSPVSPP